MSEYYLNLYVSKCPKCGEILIGEGLSDAPEYPYFAMFRHIKQQDFDCDYFEEIDILEERVEVV